VRYDLSTVCFTVVRSRCTCICVGIDSSDSPSMNKRRNLWCQPLSGFQTPFKHQSLACTPAILLSSSAQLLSSCIGRGLHLFLSMRRLFTLTTRKPRVIFIVGVTLLLAYVFARNLYILSTSQQSSQPDYTSAKIPRRTHPQP